MTPRGAREPWGVGIPLLVCCRSYMNGHNFQKSMNSTLNMRTNLYFNRADEIKHKELVFTKEVLGWNTTAIILEATEAGSCRLKCKAGKHGSLACHTEEPCVAEQTTNYVNFSFLSSALVFLSKSSVSVHRFVEVPT